MNNETGKLSFDKLLLLSSVFALFYTFCLYRNKMGLTFPLFALGTAALFLYYLRLSGRALKRGSALYLAGIALLGLNVCLTSNEIVILFDKGFIFLLFFMLFLHNLYDVATWDLSKYALSLSAMMLSTVQFLPRPVKDLGAYLNIRTGEQSKNRAPAETAGGQMKSVVFYVMVGLGISVPLLAVILPLLLSSDVIFMEFFEGVFDFDIGDDLGAILFMVVSVFVASYGMLCRFGQPMKYAATPVTDKRTHSPVIAITVNLVLLVVYLAYCGIQVVYLFLRRGTLPEGYTYSSYAHEGFFQLVFVCMINILIVLICRK